MSNIPTSDNPHIKNWREISRLIGLNTSLVDRLSFTELPYNFQVAETSRLPIELRNFNRSYSDICEDRVLELLKIQEKVKKPICLLYSGGIDSTVMATAFLKILTPIEFNEKIKVFLNPDSIRENPYFYRNYLRKKMNLESSERSLSLLDGENIVVGAEFNDQLFGSDMCAKFIAVYGSDVILEPYREKVLLQFFECLGMSKIASKMWFDILHNHIKRQNLCEVKRYFDFFWWFNFIFKWQSVYYRFLLRLPSRLRSGINAHFLAQYYHHFFCTDDFQKWSMLNSELKIGKQWSSYKLEAKKYIYEFDHNSEYFEKKIKIGSLAALFFQTNNPVAITSDFKFLYKVNSEDFYDSALK